MIESRARRVPHAVFAVLMALAIAIRSWKLDALPNPCADEGNWTWIPRNALLGRPAGLPPDARFVPMTFARMIEWSFAHFGVSFASARGVLVAGTVAGMLLTYLALSRVKLPRAACIVAAVVAMHPWAVWWSRTVSVPYAFSLACATAGPAALLAAMRETTKLRRALGFVLAAQILFVGMHFSPLCVAAIAACALWLFVRPERRGLLRERGFWAALTLGVLHAVPVVRGAVAVAARGSTRPDSQFDHFATRLYTYTRTIFGGLAGEATVRHFVGESLPLAVELLLVAAMLAFMTIVIGQTFRSNWHAAIEHPAAELRAFSAFYFVVALVVTPIILAPARPWQLRAIDSERYVFALLAPFALLLGALAESPRRSMRIATIALALYFTVPTGRILFGLAWGGGPDRGIYVLDGGGSYRGWRTPRERVAVPWLIQREVDGVMHGQPATILLADYAFHPIHFVNAMTAYPTVDVTKFPAPDHPGQRFFFVIWDDALFAPAFEPQREVRANRALRERMRRDFQQVTHLRRFVQPNGYPLFDVYTAVQPVR